MGHREPFGPRPSRLIDTSRPLGEKGGGRGGPVRRLHRLLPPLSFGPRWEAQRVHCVTWDLGGPSLVGSRLGSPGIARRSQHAASIHASP
jgi:hypothetical protein